MFIKLHTVGLLLMTCLILNGAGQVKDTDCHNMIPFPDKDNCARFYQCMVVEGRWRVLHLSCPDISIYDDNSKACIPGECEVPCVDDFPTPDFDDCNWYYQCLKVKGKWNKLHLQCTGNGTFHTVSGACVDPKFLSCEQALILQEH